MFNDNAAGPDWTPFNVVMVASLILGLVALVYGIVTGICGG